MKNCRYCISEMKTSIFLLGKTSVPSFRLPSWQFSGKGIKRYWADIYTKISILTLTFDHVIWKSILNIYSLRVTPVQSLATLKQRGKKIDWTTLGLHTDRPTGAKQYVTSFSRGGGGIKNYLNNWLDETFY